jgi:hypothetical protein
MMGVDRNGIVARYPGTCRSCSAALAVGDRVYPRPPQGWVCGACATPRSSTLPTPAELLNKITLGMVTKVSVSLRNAEAELLVRVVLAVVPDTSVSRRPVRTEPSRGWFNRVTGWDGSMDAWSAEEILGYVLDALEDRRSTNLNKGALYQLLRYMETATGKPFFFRTRLLTDADAFNFTGFDPSELRRFHNEDLPALDVPRES